MSHPINASSTDSINDPLEFPDFENSREKKENKNIVIEFFFFILSKIKSFFN
ncbi:hypothetical protein CANDROIZ_20050 [Candidatus Roizmanbacteria bacterium]|nr:hypothetical protein CANDROIZ_20050 [Candidatus Roizmanbacteria bacterium]